MDGLAEAFEKFDGILLASIAERRQYLEDEYKEISEGIEAFERRFGPCWPLCMVAEDGSLMWLCVSQLDCLGEAPEKVAEFYSENIIQRIRSLRRQCVFCGPECTCPRGPRLL